MTRKILPPAPPYLGPVAHSSGTGNKPIHRIVIHCTVSKCCVDARGIASFFRSKRAGGSAHYITSATETIQSAFDSVVAWHAPPNGHSLGIEMCCTLANQGKGHWERDDHVAMMKRTARLVAQLALAYDVPLKRLTPKDLDAGKHGICGHVDVSQAFHQSTHWDPGPFFPWGEFMRLVQAAAFDLAKSPATPTKPVPKTPVKAPKPSKTVDPAIMSATTLTSPPTDHLLVKARIKLGAAEEVVAFTNIRATPPMLKRNVQKCVDRGLSSGATVVGFAEMGARDLTALIVDSAAGRGWQAVQGPKGDKARAPIAYDDRVWEFLRWENPRLSSREVLTKLGKIAVPSGNRDATTLVLRHRKTGVEAAFLCYHSIAHVNVGAGFGWTGKGPKALLALRTKIANPAITVYKQGMRELEAQIVRLREQDLYVVPMGDWNYDAFADLRDKTPEKYGPRQTMARAGVTTIYAAKKLRRGTDLRRKRGIDYIGVAGPKGHAA